MDARCLACHGEIAWHRERQRGLHARAREACARCHPDHAGRDFALVAWDGGAPEKFDHRRAGWPLDGEHATAACRDCHKPAFQRSGGAAMIRRRDRAQSWLGLEAACASCHDDPHRGRLDARCVTCHDTRAWKPAPRFDHSRTAYPLTGRHAKVPCASCHETAALADARDPRGKPAPVYHPVPHADCASCHRDPHAGRFGAACAKCHTSTDDFRTLKAGSFDHDKTRYPLRGRHASVPCAKCHDPRQGGREKPAFATCASCHADAHGGQVTGAGLARPAGAAIDCAACHTVQGYRPATFTVAQHAATKYALEGAHARVPCEGCHAQRAPAKAAGLGPARVPLHPAYDRCARCHQDPHAGRFSPGGARARAEDCLACHTVTAFRPARFDAAAHAAAGFALDGAHAAVPCQACHPTLEAAPARGALRALAFEDAKRRCEDCHPGPHGTQFAQRHDRGACEGCHGADAFVPASRFDHSRDSGFELDGAHAKVACAACHRTNKDAAGVARVIYRPVPHRCEDCHVPRMPSSGGRTSVRALPRSPAFAAILPREVAHAVHRR
jgi:hypothetical protein